MFFRSLKINVYQVSVITRAGSNAGSNEMFYFFLSILSSILSPVCHAALPAVAAAAVAVARLVAVVERKIFRIFLIQKLFI